MRTSAHVGSQTSPMQVPEKLQGVVRGLHHVAIAVESLETGAKFYTGALGIAAAEPELVAQQGVRVLVLCVGDVRLELVEPTSPDTPVGRFLEKSGPGIHHLAWRVDSVAAAIDVLLSHAVRMIDVQPQPGSHGTRVAFVHPSATGGVLMELVEDPGQD